MPATQRGQAYRLGPNRWGLRYYDAAGVRRRKSPFPSKSAALTYYRDIVEPELRGDTVPMPELTLSELVELFLERHAASVRARARSTRCASGSVTRWPHMGTYPCTIWSACPATSPGGARGSPKGSVTPA